MRAHWPAILLLAAACTPEPAPVKPQRQHPEFPIDAGTPHAIGRLTFNSQVKCTSCHALTNATYRQFDCLGCHEHSMEAALTNHDKVTGYMYASTACYGCHGPQASLKVGGFFVSQPPAADATTMQAGIPNLPHPAVPSAGLCTTCHLTDNGGRGAFGYDHALAPETGCSACHEAGSNLVGSPWTLDAGAVPVAAQCGQGGGMIADRGGDTRPIGIANLACSSNAANLTCGSQNCSLNHFYPSDCGECHVAPVATPSLVQTGAPYAANWAFQHNFALPTQPTTCCNCHAPPSCRP
jgi:hypothetical protein